MLFKTDPKSAEDLPSSTFHLQPPSVATMNLLPSANMFAVAAVGSPTTGSDSNLTGHEIALVANSSSLLDLVSHPYLVVVLV